MTGYAPPLGEESYRAQQADVLRRLFNLEMRQTVNSSGSSGGSGMEADYYYNGALAVLTGTSRRYNLTGRTLTISTVVASVGTAPAGASIIVDVRKNGASIFTTTANRPTITAGTQYATAGGTPDVPTIAAGEYWTIDIVQVGSTTAGASLVVQVEAL